MTKRASTLLFSMALLMSACGGGDGAGDDADGVAQTYAPELDVDLSRMSRSETGLYTEDVKVGISGEAVTTGQTAIVHYTGSLPSGTEFDTSRDGDPPLEFTLGQGNVIPGWEEGVAGMRVGGRRKLVIPQHLAYGSAGAGGVIPPYATLVFDVELVGIRGSEAAAPDTTPRDSVGADTTTRSGN